MLDHLGFGVRDYPRAKEFYQAALAPLGMVLIIEIDSNSEREPACGFGKTETPGSGSQATTLRRACTSLSPPRRGQRSTISMRRGWRRADVTTERRG